MWTFIIILVVIMIGKFIYDSSKQSEQVKSEGGMREKYSTLIEYLLDHPNSRIYQETNTFLSIGVSSAAGSTVYYLQQTYGNITIQMKIKNNPLIGNINMEWTFPESMNQRHMIQKIENDIQMRMFN